MRKKAEKRSNAIKEKRKEEVFYPIVDMGKRKNVEIYYPDDDGEEDCLLYYVNTQNQRENIRKTYYGINTPILKTEKRTFLDLLKIFYFAHIKKKLKLFRAKK